MKILSLTLTPLLAIISLTTAAEENRMPDKAKLEQMGARFAPTEIKADLARLSSNDRKVLARLVQASEIIDGLFLRQAWAENPSMLLDLAKDTTPEGRARLHYFLINKGPWSNLDHNAPFVAGAPAKPESAGFYPPDASKSEIESWINSLPADQQQSAKGFFTVVKRQADKKLTLVPYNIEYQGELIAAARLDRKSTRLNSS